MKTNEAGKRLIKSFEGCRLTAYKCPAGVWTIGYGETAGVHEGMVITQEQADQMFDSALARYEIPVMNVVAVPLNENQFSALVSLSYNIGNGAFGRSTLLRKLNESDYSAAAEQFLVWNKGGGKVLNGLTRRREAERALFLLNSDAAVG
jgi:lysozyme